MRYPTAAAFRMALEERIKQRSAAEGTALWRMRKRVAFERLLARLQAQPNGPWLLKGAFALDLRFRDRARSTKDVDLSIDVSLVGAVPFPDAKIVDILRDAAAYSLPDFFIYSIPSEGEEVLHEKGSPTYRFTVHSSLAGRLFEELNVDVSTRQELVAHTEEVLESDVLSFAGIVPGRFRAISLSQQLAEKIHAFTFPWENRENTRVKDLVDLVLILEISPPDPNMSRTAVEAIFSGRATHPVPGNLPSPPVSWSGSYTAAATELTLTHTTIDDAIRFVGQYWATLFP
jgi:hypothetical protein